MTTRLIHVRQMSKLAGPIILANLAAPILGFVDTAVIGQLGQTHLLGALALASKRLMRSMVLVGRLASSARSACLGDAQQNESEREI